MRKVVSLGIVCVFLLSLALPAIAQEDEMMDHVVCDSTLISLLLVAESNGFHSMTDTSIFEKGQYTDFFDSMMAMMDENMGDEGMTDEDMGDEAMTDETMTDEGMMDMVTLEPGNIEGEPTECTDLRAEIDTWIFGYFADEFGTMMDEG